MDKEEKMRVTERERERSIVLFLRSFNQCSIERKRESKKR